MANEKPPDLATVPLRINCRSAYGYRKKFPHWPGLYFAFHEKHGLLYIGQTKSMKHRMRQHWWVYPDTRIAWITGLDKQQRLELESWLIRTFDPQWNICHNAKNRKNRRIA